MGKSKDAKPAAAGAKGKADNKADKSKKGGSSKGSKPDAEGTSSESKSTTKVKGAMSINVRHILCEKFSKSEEAMQRLKNGEKFDAVAREMSEDKAKSGGSLGWQTKGNLDPAFEKVAFELPASSVDKPTYERVKTGFGYHIIMVEGRK